MSDHPLLSLTIDLPNPEHEQGEQEEYDEFNNKEGTSEMSTGIILLQRQHQLENDNLEPPSGVYAPLYSVSVPPATTCSTSLPVEQEFMMNGDEKLKDDLVCQNSQNLVIEEENSKVSIEVDKKRPLINDHGEDDRCKFNLLQSHVLTMDNTLAHGDGSIDVEGLSNFKNHEVHNEPNSKFKTSSLSYSPLPLILTSSESKDMKTTTSPPPLSSTESSLIGFSQYKLMSTSFLGKTPTFTLPKDQKTGRVNTRPFTQTTHARSGFPFVSMKKANSSTNLIMNTKSKVSKEELILLQKIRYVLEKDYEQDSDELDDSNTSSYMTQENSKFIRKGDVEDVIIMSAIDDAIKGNQSNSLQKIDAGVVDVDNHKDENLFLKHPILFSTSNINEKNRSKRMTTLSETNLSENKKISNEGSNTVYTSHTNVLISPSTHDKTISSKSNPPIRSLKGITSISRQLKHTLSNTNNNLSRSGSPMNNIPYRNDKIGNSNSEGKFIMNPHSSPHGRLTPSTHNNYELGRKRDGISIPQKYKNRLPLKPFQNIPSIEYVSMISEESTFTIQHDSNQIIHAHGQFDDLKKQTTPSSLSFEEPRINDTSNKSSMASPCQSHETQHLTTMRTIDVHEYSNTNNNENTILNNETMMTMTEKFSIASLEYLKRHNLMSTNNKANVLNSGNGKRNYTPSNLKENSSIVLDAQRIRELPKLRMAGSLRPIGRRFV